MAYYGLKYVNSIEFPPGIQDGLLIFDPFFSQLAMFDYRRVVG